MGCGCWIVTGGAMLELDSMRCRIGGSSNAKMKYHYSIRSNLSIGSLHDLQLNKGQKQEVLQPVTAFLEQLHLLWISITGSVSHSGVSPFMHLSLLS